MAVIETKSLTKYYGKSRGIEGLDLEVNEGEVFGFLGPNGAGKTTTIRSLLGLIMPTGGSASVFGLDIVRDSVAIRARTGYIPGDPSFYPKMTGHDLLDYLANFRPGNPPVLRDELTRRFDLDLSKRCKDYSRGNKQKLAIVVAFMHDPDLLVLDEPTLGLDPFMQKEFYSLMEDFRQRGKTVLLSSHILGDVDKTCERVGIIKEGKLVTVEKVHELESKKVHRVTAIFSDEVKTGEFDLPGVSITRQNDRSIELKIKGEIDPVIKALARHKLVDLDFEHASLEEIFLEFYGDEA
ncbi:MAG: ABC transporter ATP-binding protein [Actinomycetota bacterium]